MHEFQIPRRVSHRVTYLGGLTARDVCVYVGEKGVTLATFTGLSDDASLGFASVEELRKLHEKIGEALCGSQSSVS